MTWNDVDDADVDVIDDADDVIRIVDGLDDLILLLCWNHDRAFLDVFSLFR